MLRNYFKGRFLKLNSATSCWFSNKCPEKWWIREEKMAATATFVPATVPVIQSPTSTCLQPHAYDSRHTYWHISAISPPNNVKNSSQLYFQLCYFSFRHIWKYNNSKSLARSLLFPSGWFCYCVFFFFFCLHTNTAGLCLSETERNWYWDVLRMYCSYQGSGFPSNSNHTKFDIISSSVIVSCLQLWRNQSVGSISDFLLVNLIFLKQIW